MLVGASFGAIAVGAGLPAWFPSLLSVVVFAGASQFMLVGILAVGGNPVAAVLAALLVNIRHIPFGFALSDVLGHRWKLGSHFVIDESVAYSLSQPDPARRRQAYWLCGVGLFVAWNLGVLAGALGGARMAAGAADGARLADAAALGLDAAFPAVLIALTLPALSDPVTRGAALAGAVVAVAAAPFTAPGVPVLLALLGLLVVRKKEAVL